MFFVRFENICHSLSNTTTLCSVDPVLWRFVDMVKIKAFINAAAVPIFHYFQHVGGILVSISLKINLLSLSSQSLV